MVLLNVTNVWYPGPPISHHPMSLSLRFIQMPRRLWAPFSSFVQPATIVNRNLVSEGATVGLPMCHPPSFLRIDRRADTLSETGSISRCEGVGDGHLADLLATRNAILSCMTSTWCSLSTSSTQRWKSGRRAFFTAILFSCHSLQERGVSGHLFSIMPLQPADCAAGVYQPNMVYSWHSP